MQHWTNAPTQFKTAIMEKENNVVQSSDKTSSTIRLRRMGNNKDG
jgi:hypothetical protein